MIEIFGFLAVVYIIYSNKSLSNRLEDIELKLKNGAGEVKPEPVNSGNIFKENTSTPNNFIREENTKPHGFFVWLKEDWLMKLGAFLFIVGFGWFVSYAFVNNWIGPVGRISIGIIAGILMMAFGFKWMTKHASQGALFMALGAGMAMLTIFAGRSIYGFFTPATAVLFDFILVSFISFASYKFNIKTLAFLAQILAFVTPLLAAGQTDSIFLFSYLFFVSLATLFLAGVTGWRDLITSSLIFVGMYSFPYISAPDYNNYYVYGNIYSNDAPVILNFAYLFSLLYLFIGMFAVVKKGVQDSKNEITLAVLNGLFLFLWIYNVADKEFGVLIFTAWAIVFAISSFIAFKFSEKLDPFYAYGSVAIAFIAAATSMQLDGASLTIAFTIEILLLVLSVFALTKNIKATVKTSWLFLVPVFLSLSSIMKYTHTFSKELFSADFFVLILIAISMILVGRLITNAQKVNGAQDGDELNAGSVLIVFGTLYLGYILWQFLHILINFDLDMATMTSLVIFTIFGLVAYFAGLYGNDGARRTYGIALLSFVVIRLIFVDVWDMELFGRVVTFLAIGVLLMSTAFLTKKKKHESEIIKA